MSSLWRTVALALAAVALASVFGMYLHPDFMVQISNQIWACF